MNDKGLISKICKMLLLGKSDQSNFKKGKLSDPKIYHGRHRDDQQTIGKILKATKLSKHGNLKYKYILYHIREVCRDLEYLML